MPVIILVVALGIIVWSQWNTRQTRTAVAESIESLFETICNGDSTGNGIRWADAVIRDSVVNSMEELCSSSDGDPSAVVVDEPSEDGSVEVRITSDSRTVMTLKVEPLSGGALLVRGWSSE